MQEVIAKSKFYKHERQKEKEEVDKLVDEVDADLDDIRNLLSFGKSSDKKHPVGENSSNATVQSSTSTRAPLPPQQDDYDRFLAELKFEARGKPSDRLKSEEEIAAEEKTKLEKLEVFYIK